MNVNLDSKAMTPKHRTILAVSAVCLAWFSPAILMGQDSTDAPSTSKVACERCEEWNAPHEPFKVFGNLYYVGTAGLSSLLLSSRDGHILFDGGLPQSAAVIEKNIRTLGFNPDDIRLIVVSHEHYDHVGGVSALQQLTGAKVVASPAAAKALQQGGPLPEDPQFAFGKETNSYPPVKAVRVVKNGEKVRVGDLAVTANFTPGHTPGSTTWTWKSCQRNECLDVVYADSLNAVSAPEYKFSAHPEALESFRQSIDKVRNLSCQIMISVHPGQSGLDEKLKLRKDGVNMEPFIDRKACRSYASAALDALEKRLASEN